MSARASQAGFVLVTSIWVLAALVLFVSFISIAAEKVIADTQGIRLKVQSMLDMRATESTVLYLLATQPKTRAGVTTTPLKTLNDIEKPKGADPFSGDIFTPVGGEIRLDGRGYSGIGDIQFALQDTSASISLRANRPEAREKLRLVLQSYDVSNDEIVQLIDKLRDYVDRDSVPSINGMEGSAYEDAGYEKSTNRFLSSPTQLKNIPGWSEALGENFDGFLELVTIDTGNRPNFNTAHPGLMTLYGIDAEAVRKVVEFRRQGVIKTLSEVNEITGNLIAIDPLLFSSVSGNFIRLILWDRTSGQAHWIGIKLTPRVGNAPFKIDYRVAVPHTVLPSPMDSKSADDIAMASKTPQSPLFW